MKQLLFLLLICTTFRSFAQDYKDALYAEYKRVYTAEETDAFKGGFTKPTVATRVFSVSNPVMQQAMKASGMEDSLAIVTLSREIQTRFFDNDYLPMAVPGYDTAMLPLLRLYNDEMCDCMNKELSRATNKPYLSNLFWAITNCEKSSKVQQKIVAFKKTHSDPTLHTTTEVLCPYLYVYCSALREGLIKESVTEAINNYLWHRRTILNNLEEGLLTTIKTGNANFLQGYFPEEKDLEAVTKYLSKISTRIAEIKGTYKDLQYLIHSADTKMVYDYAYNGTVPEILGGIELFTNWQQGRLLVNKYHYYPADKVKRGEAFIELLRRRTGK